MLFSDAYSYAELQDFHRYRAAPYLAPYRSKPNYLASSRRHQQRGLGDFFKTLRYNEYQGELENEDDLTYQLINEWPIDEEDRNYNIKSKAEMKSSISDGSSGSLEQSVDWQALVGYRPPRDKAYGGSGYRPVYRSPGYAGKNSSLLSRAQGDLDLSEFLFSRPGFLQTREEVHRFLRQ